VNQIDKIQTLTNKASELKVMTEHLEYLQEAVKKAEETIKNLSEQELPMLMNEIGMQQFKLQDGTKFEVKPILAVNAPKEKMEEIDEWLDNNGHSGLVKTTILVPKTVPHDALEKLLIEFKAQGFDFDVTKSIHWQTLNKWAREMEEEGYAIPEDLFKVYRAMKAFIT
jgi:hypothetical protein